MIQVSLKGGDIKAFEKGITPAQIAQSIGSGLYKASCAALIDGNVCDLRTPIDADCALSLLTFDSEDGKKAFRHTASHVLAQAVLKLYPQAKLAIGPAIDTGFYYDFDIDTPFSAESLDAIEKEMAKIISDDLIIEQFTLSKPEALALMKDQPYKLELIEQLPGGEEISFYKQGGFVDLCAGPHLMSTGGIAAFKLLSCTGAYWKGDSKNKMLQRIYGTAFSKQSDLNKYLTKLEEAKSNDHNMLGRSLKLFTTSDPVGQGLPLLMPKGAKVIQIMQRFIEDESERRGYLITKTPIMAKNDLYKISGHWDHYQDGMFIMGDENDPDYKEDVLALRPMTCPFQFMIYNSELHSYKELPVRYSETATLCRNESSGEMHGLIRVRQFTLSDAHIIVTKEQVKQEFTNAFRFINDIMNIIGITDDISYRFSKWDPNNIEKYLNDPAAWEETQQMMRVILDEIGIEYAEADGEAAFYGPKLDIQMKNVHGKEDTLITIQIDFGLAERFDMSYVDADGAKKRPYIIHHSIIGCYERTLALLIEKTGGAFPLWLAPEQVRILPISEKQLEYAKSICRKMTGAGLRAAVDDRNEKVGYKIREAQLQKIPYMAVVGDKEIEDNAVSVRSRTDADKGTMGVNEFINDLVLQNQNKQ